MKIAELRATNKEELPGIILSSKKEQFNLRMQAGAGEQANGGRFKELRKTIARAKTLLNEPPQSAATTKSTAKAAKKSKKG